MPLMTSAIILSPLLLALLSAAISVYHCYFQPLFVLVLRNRPQIMATPEIISVPRTEEDRAAVSQSILYHKSVVSALEGDIRALMDRVHALQVQRSGLHGSLQL